MTPSISTESIFSPLQHGFLKGRSTTTNLTQFESRTLCSLKQGYEIDVVTTDFSKAFDEISHQIIILKLRAYGFPPLFIQWIGSYLNQRFYRVVFRGSIFTPISATSGVPQRSHLGPFLLVLAINDVDKIISHSDFSIYADDIKIIKIISKPSDSSFLSKQCTAYP